MNWRSNHHILDARVGHALFCIVILCGAVASRAGIPTLFKVVHGREMTANCGINVTAFALGYFRKPVDLCRVATALRAGSDWGDAPNMLRIKQALVASGLQVAAYKGATLADASRQMARHPRRSLAIMFIKNDMGVGRFGHYLVLLDDGPTHFFVADIGSFIGREILTNLNNRIGADFSGLFLLVRPGGAPAASEVHAITDKQIVLRAGEIARGPGMIRVSFLVRNTTHQPVSIALAKGTCYCFRGARIIGHDGKIASGKVGKVVMSFKRDVIGIGNIEREVLFKFAGYPNHIMRVVIHAHITADHPPAQLTWYPQAVDLGVVRNRSALGGQEVTVLTPKGISLQTPVASSKFVNVIRLNDLGGQPQIDDFGRTAHEYVLDLSRLPAGAVNEKVTIGTTDKYVPKIVITITGQIEETASPSAKGTP